MDVPELTDELTQMIADQSDAQSGHKTIRELERLRDNNLIAIMRALKQQGSAAGALITAHEETLRLPLGRRCRCALSLAVFLSIGLTTTGI